MLLFFTEFDLFFLFADNSVVGDLLWMKLIEAALFFWTMLLTFQIIIINQSYDEKLVLVYNLCFVTVQIIIINQSRSKPFMQSCDGSCVQRVDTYSSRLRLSEVNWRVFLTLLYRPNKGIMERFVLSLVVVAYIGVVSLRESDELLWFWSV